MPQWDSIRTRPQAGGMQIRCQHVPLSGKPALAQHFGVALGLHALICIAETGGKRRSWTSGTPSTANKLGENCPPEHMLIPISIYVPIYVFPCRCKHSFLQLGRNSLNKCQPGMFHLLFNELSLNQKEKKRPARTCLGSWWICPESGSGEPPRFTDDTLPVEGKSS